MSYGAKSRFRTDEIELASRLRTYGVRIFEGTTTFEQRRERTRNAITQHGLAESECWKDGRSVTYAQAFEQIYEQALDAPPSPQPLNGSAHA